MSEPNINEFLKILMSFTEQINYKHERAMHFISEQMFVNIKGWGHSEEVVL